MAHSERRSPGLGTAVTPRGTGGAPDDHILLQRVVARDESALTALYNRWAQRIHTVALSIVRDADEAEDVVEETFYQAWRSAARFDEQRAAVSTWLIMIARSRALDRLRRQRRAGGPTGAARMAEELIGSSEEERADVNGGQFELGAPSTALADALAALPADQMTVIKLAFFTGLTHADIAARSGLPLGTVKTRIRLAMRKLRERLATLPREDL